MEAIRKASRQEQESKNHKIMILNHARSEREVARPFRINYLHVEPYTIDLVEHC